MTMPAYRTRSYAAPCISGLRVADASVMPRIITGPGTNESTHMIAGRAARLILGQEQGIA